ncbi:hypothetical protein BKA62DRAFT_697063 [Auriculariales sp. MPI-PUGE-AT-0066]|nr:hypothetical protein BKA62DRAFT_697063 [Auriculariales sp. MPI-PUGE-AT-0066]
MGFFSSRRAQPEPLLVNQSTAPANTDERGLSRIIKSRFYSKSRLTKSERAVLDIHASLASQPLPSTDQPAHQPAAHSLRQAHSTPALHQFAAPRAPTDNVTMSLAQRLNELSSANENGLLDDDQYRLLRQNLFERYTSQPDIQTDVVAANNRMSTPVAESSTMARESTPTPTPRAPSVHSSKSVASAMSALFRRGTVTRKQSKDSFNNRSSFSVNAQDSASLRSRPSIASPRTSISQHAKAAPHPSISISNFSSRLQRKPSMSSIQSDSSYGDAMSVASRKTGGRSQKSRGPPSSFNLKLHDNTPLPEEQEQGLDQQTLINMTPAEIREEISRVEAEARRLLDAYSGLEITTLAKRQDDVSATHRRQPLERRPSNWTLVPEDPTDSVVSQAASTLTRSSSSTFAKFGSIKSSSSSGSVRAKSTHLALPSHSSSSMIISPTVDEEEDEELVEMRRKRDQMRVRYDRKVEYLQAMLRNAEIREKLNRKRR